MEAAFLNHFLSEITSKYVCIKLLTNANNGKHYSHHWCKATLFTFIETINLTNKYFQYLIVKKIKHIKIQVQNHGWKMICGHL
jgi:hypothetical protein